MNFAPTTAQICNFRTTLVEIAGGNKKPSPVASDCQEKVKAPEQPQAILGLTDQTSSNSSEKHLSESPQDKKDSKKPSIKQLVPFGAKRTQKAVKKATTKLDQHVEVKEEPQETEMNEENKESSSAPPKSVLKKNGQYAAGKSSPTGETGVGSKRVRT